MGKTILVAVSDIGLSSLIRKSLEGSAYLVVQTNTVRAMVKVLESRSIDLSLIDEKIHAQIKKTKGYKDHLQTPYVIIANHPDKNIAAEYVKQGAKAYLHVEEGFSSSFTKQVDKVLRNQENELRLPISDGLTKESEYLLKNILDTFKDPVYICSERHSMQYANPVLKSLIGNRVQKKKCYSAVFNSFKSCSECPSLNSLKEGSYTSHFQMSVNDETRHFQASITPIYFQNGSISRLNILKDVTDLIQTRNQAENNERKFRLVADNAIDMVWQMDLRLKFTYLSPSAETILGYRIDEMLGRNLWEFTRKRYFIKMARYAMNAIKNYKTFDHITFESKLTHKNDYEVPVEITGKLLKDQNGTIIGLQGSTKDITERFRNQSEMQKQHQLLRTLIDNIPDDIYVKDLSNRYLLNNIEHQKELKVKNQDEVLHKTDHHYYDQATADEFARDEQQIIESGTPMINKEEYIQRKTGEEKMEADNQSAHKGWKWQHHWNCRN